MSRHPLGPTKFFLEDIVRQDGRKSDGSENDLGIVLRHWHDSETSGNPGDQYETDPLNRPLERYEIGVSYLLTGNHSIVHESDFHLVDRSLPPGELVKRTVHDVQSGVILSTHVDVKLEHAISMTEYNGWVSADELEPAMDLYIGDDYVIYDDWVGQIEEVFDEAICELTSKQLFCFAELGGRYQVGERGPDILPDASLQHLQESGSALPEVLVSVKPTVLAVSWLAVNQTLDPAVAAAKTRPKQFWKADEFQDLCIVRPRTTWRLSDRVRFKDPSMAALHGVKNTRHGDAGFDSGLIESDVLIIRETRTSFRILWQDGFISDNVRSTDIVPYTNPDEYDCWPGDYVIWKGEDESRSAVVQFVEARQRTAQVFWKTPPTSTTPGVRTASYETVSVLELDTHGGSVDHPTDTVGVRRGDFVFLHKEGSTNGAPLPYVPRIGEREAWVSDIDPNGWRHDMAHVGLDYAQREDAAKIHDTSGSGPRQLGAHVDYLDSESRLRWGNPDGLDWFGEVVNMRTSGDIEVALASGKTVTVPLERLTLLVDTRDTGLDFWPEDMEDIEPAQGAGFVGSVAQVISQFFGYNPQNGANTNNNDADNGSHGSWESYEAMDVDENYEDMPALEPTSPSDQDQPPPPVTSDAIAPQSATETSPAALQEDPAPSPPSHEPMSAEEEDDQSERPWRRFRMLPSAPPDHAFIKKLDRGAQARNFMTRLSKEYKLLSNGLPDTIVVHAYEDRTDLLRSLIIGPDNTPYEDAPFVIDWYLDESFPQTPPIAHFHSWTNGNGRVNPNLYEEGKVCLSVLGTWAGDTSESWSAARSSVMQALISIQGLVLVKEPWFCEPAYEKLRGTHEGVVNSRLYSERAYVLSRAFVRKAVESPPEGLKEDLDWWYFEQGKLAKVISDAQALIKASQKSGSVEDVMKIIPGWEDKAVPKLTMGGILPLQRTLTRLESILSERSQID